MTMMMRIPLSNPLQRATFRLTYPKAHTRTFTILNNQALSGHNKWSTIKHDKMKNDSARNKLINRYANQIAVAVRLKDPRLNALIESATKANVPKKVIDNAIKKASQTGAAGDGTLNLYEGMGPGGVAIIIEAVTDNKNRTVGLVRSYFNKANLNLLSVGSALHYFDKVGRILFSVDEAEHIKEDEVFDKLLEVDGIKDFEKLDEGVEQGLDGENERGEEKGSAQTNHDTVSDTKADSNGSRYVVITEPTLTNKVAIELRDKQGFVIEETSIIYSPKEEMRVDLSQDETIRESFDKFLRGLRDIDDVVNVYSNEVR